jgi:hypothetical protein
LVILNIGKRKPAIHLNNKRNNNIMRMYFIAREGTEIS